MNRLKLEGDCCATVSILYSTPVSTVHTTEAKYSGQDMVTTLSGNIEAWIGISAAHIYLFFENLYNALVEARLISTVSSRPSTGVESASGSRTGPNGGCFGIGIFLISILTILRVKISQLFTYLFHQLAKLLWFKINKVGNGATVGPS